MCLAALRSIRKRHTTSDNARSESVVFAEQPDRSREHGQLVLLVGSTHRHRVVDVDDHQVLAGFERTQFKLPRRCEEAPKSERRDVFVWIVVSLTFTSWNRITDWLRQLDRMRATG